MLGRGPPWHAGGGISHPGLPPGMPPRVYIPGIYASCIASQAVPRSTLVTSMNVDCPVLHF